MLYGRTCRNRLSVGEAPILRSRPARENYRIQSSTSSSDTSYSLLLLSRCYIPLGPWRPNNSEFLSLKGQRPVRDIIAGHLGLPLGQPSDVHQLRAGGTCPQYIVSTIPEALPPQGFVSPPQSICSYNRVLIAPCLQSPLTIIFILYLIVNIYI